MATEVSRSVVHIHIDHQSYTSPDHTTGAALYALGNVGPEQSLYRDVHGDKNDEAIENDQDAIEVHEGDQFRTGPKKTYTVYINGQAKTVSGKRLSYAQVVALAFPGGNDMLYTVTYEGGPAPNREGSLQEGGTVKIQNGMIFNVTPTNRS